MDDSESTPLEMAAGRLYDHLGCGVYPHHVVSIGTAAKGPYNDTDRIHVYLAREPLTSREEVPEVWEGFPVETKVTGPLVPMGPS